METKMYVAMVIIALIICVAAFYQGLVIRTYKISHVKVHKNGAIRIAVIADLHSVRHDKLVDIIKKISPDLIAMTGDIIDDHRPMKYVIKYFEEFAKLNIPKYYVTGNHDIYLRDLKQIKDMLRGYNITVLDFDKLTDKININGTNVIISGFDDPHKEKNIDAWKKRLYREYNNIDFNNQKGYKILLSHRPDLWQIYEDLGFDLALSGHAHGGQVRIPFILNGLYAPNQGLFPQYAGGVYKHWKLTHVVSRGLAVYINLPRVFNPPEIVKIDIFPEDS
jgi:predicted MPP superfamily phosphohydrolase